MTTILTYSPITYAYGVAIAAALGPDWRACEPTTESEDQEGRGLTFAYVGADPDFQSVTLRCDADRQKLKGRWRWHVRRGDADYQAVLRLLGEQDRAIYYTEITTTAPKPWDDAAASAKLWGPLTRQIQRRLLGVVLEVHVKLLQERRATALKILNDNSLAQALCDAAGPGSRVSREATVERQRAQVDVQVNHRTAHFTKEWAFVQVETLYLTPQQALELAALIAHWNARAKTEGVTV